MRFPRTAAAALAGAVLVASATPASAAAFMDDGLWWYDALRIDEVHQDVTGAGVDIALIDAGLLYAEAPELQGQDVRPTASACADASGQGEGPLTAGPSELSGHTTSMAALLVGNGRGTGPGGRGVPGLVPDATLRTYVIADAVREADAFGREGLRACAHGERMSASELLRRVLDDGADVVVVPAAWPGDPDRQAVIDEAVRNGVIIVNSAGNGGPGQRIVDIGAEAGVVNVTAGDRTGAFWPQNSAKIEELFYIDELGRTTADPDKGVSLHPDETGQYRPTLSAPGVEILTGGVIDGAWRSDATVDGTSPAAAIVGGALALAMERWPDAHGNQVLQSLVRNANRAGELDYDLYVGFGGLSLSAMLATDPTAYPDVHPFYGGLRWALVDDPPQPVYVQPDEDGLYRWAPTYSPEELAEQAEADAASAGPPAGAPEDSAADADPEAGADTGSSSLPWLWAGLALLVAAAGGGLAVRRRRHDDDDNNTGQRPAGHDLQGAHQ